MVSVVHLGLQHLHLIQTGAMVSKCRRQGEYCSSGCVPSFVAPLALSVPKNLSVQWNTTFTGGFGPFRLRIWPYFAETSDLAGEDLLPSVPETKPNSPLKISIQQSAYHRLFPEFTCD